MAKGKKRIPKGLQEWMDARARYELSHCHVQMARELGLKPAKLGGIANHRQERWKIPLPEYIEKLYEKQFGRPRPDVVSSIEERIVKLAAKEAEKRKRRKARSESASAGFTTPDSRPSEDPGDVEDAPPF